MKRISKIGALLTASIIPVTTLAHVRYIATEADVAQYGGQNIFTLTKPLLNPTNIMLMIVGLAVLWFIYFGALKINIFKKFGEMMSSKLNSYKVFVPWILRLSLGIMLIGGGIKGTLISPVLDHQLVFSQLQIILGFLMLAGFLQRLTSLATIILYIIALSMDYYIIGSAEIFAMSFGLLISPVNKPGLDDILNINLPPKIPEDVFIKITGFITRISMGISLAFLAVYEKFLNPDLSKFVVIKTELQNVIHVSPEMWVLSAGLIEFALGIMLLIGKKTRVTSAVAFVVLALSFFYFKEDVASHITLFGAMSLLFILGDKYTKIKNRE